MSNISNNSSSTCRCGEWVSAKARHHLHLKSERRNHIECIIPLLHSICHRIWLYIWTNHAKKRLKTILTNKKRFFINFDLIFETVKIVFNSTLGPINNVKRILIIMIKFIILFSCFHFLCNSFAAAEIADCSILSA